MNCRYLNCLLVGLATLISLRATLHAADTNSNIAGSTEVPLVQMLVPGFTVRELPVKLSNLNNVEYAPDGRLFAAGYDGRLHLLRDTDGDGLEDQVTTFWDKPSGDYPLGMVVRGDSVFVMFRNEVARFRDTDGDGVPDKHETAITGWDDPAIANNPLFLHRRVDFAMGLVIAPDGSYYLCMGNAAYNNGYMVDKDGQSHYSRSNPRGCVLHISADGTKVDRIATGVRYVMSLQFNRHGDLFASDQEGATWLPNGNPFDELLHIQTGRHYGFPPRHPKYLPDAIDEPSVFDYSPQHQSTCGFRFNESGPGRGRFGPSWWEGDALVTGESRGKLFRTKLVKTPAGYVAQNQLIAALQTLAVDCTLSPKGDLVIATHTGKPDWGSGPSGIGRIFKISYDAKTVPQPTLVYAASPTETRIQFDQPLNPTLWKNTTRQSSLQSGRYVGAGDRLETFRPGYATVKLQQAEPKNTHAILAAALSPDGRSLTLRTAARVEAVNYALTLPAGTQAANGPEKPNTLSQQPLINLAHDLTGVEAEWQSRDQNTNKPVHWAGWLPHPDLTVARELTAASADHGQLFTLLKQAGTLRLHGQLDLWLMLRAITQPGSKLDFEYPAETVTVVFESNSPLRLEAGGQAKVERINDHAVRLIVQSPAQNQWTPYELTLDSQAGIEPSLSVHWYTAEDSRARALPLRRALLPWAKPAGTAPATGTREIPEISGGNWPAGRKLFFSEQVACFKCHTIRNEGGDVGPDLSNLTQRDYASVYQDVTQPSAAINPDHIAYNIELKDGDSLTAVIAGESDTELVLADATGKKTPLAKTRIASMKPSSISLMPEGLLQNLSPQQVRDLMTFLLTEPVNGKPATP